ncbi:hypothetical protein DA075_10070 [Methylobacterium currus]|uniref:Uncharacterized protein n=1 Tax=Methylobacterium currus TaxID=2051553 RepID=A0A2R4WI62_9HYPH|nr:hypothetical protein [Methylobacterium currus]AWB21218.1 hypothetical protein DA075_10070 [Methylobacterium currus]
MSRPARLKPNQPDPLSDAFAASYEEGLTLDAVAQRHHVCRERVRRAFSKRRGFSLRMRRDDNARCMARAADQAHAMLDEVRARRVDPSPRFAIGTSTAIHILRARCRIVGPLCVDSPTIAAAHAAGLTLDDIHEVFAVPPVEAVRAIAAHAGR